MRDSQRNKILFNVIFWMMTPLVIIGFINLFGVLGFQMPEPDTYSAYEAKVMQLLFSMALSMAGLWVCALIAIVTVLCGVFIKR